jgi:hypothetical protein
MRALPRLYDASLDSATFADYGGHLLLALALIATTSSNVRVRETARSMALERAHDWRARWSESRAGLTSDTVMQAVIAIYASERLGLEHDSIRADVQRAVDTYTATDLVYFDPSIELVPNDIPHDCVCGRVNIRGTSSCTQCGRDVEFLSRYETWYYALTCSYFCQYCGLSAHIHFRDVLQRLAELRPYPAPGEPGFYHGIYAATHVVYTLNDYGTYLLPQTLLAEERTFLRQSVDWAIAQGEADTIGELLDSLIALGIPDEDRQVTAARRFLLDSQLPNGTWGDEEGDRYAYFHTLWAAIDGLRDHDWQGEAPFEPTLRQTLVFLQR